MKIAFLCFLIYSTYALHEHYKHLDIGYVEGETRRVA
jgi:hypothetical protein